MIIEISHFFTILATGLFLLSGFFAVAIKNTEYILLFFNMLFILYKIIVPVLQKSKQV